jgi:hypothetical protein
MQPNTNKLITAAIAATLMGSAAHAVTISESYSITESLHSAGDTLNFDISALLAGSGLLNPEITGIELTAYGYSGANYDSHNTVGNGYGYQTTANYSEVIGTYSYSCGFAGWSTCYGTNYGYVLDRNVTQYYTQSNTDTVQDSLTVAIGTNSGSGQVSINSSSPSSSTQFIGNSSNGTFGYDSDYTTVTTDYSGYYGVLSASVAAPTGSLLSIGTTKDVSVTLSSSVGSVNVTGELLSITAIEGPAPVKVPEPGITLLMGAGLALLAATRRKRTAAIG